MNFNAVTLPVWQWQAIDAALDNYALMMHTDKIRQHVEALQVRESLWTQLSTTKDWPPEELDATAYLPDAMWKCAFRAFRSPAVDDERLSAIEARVKVQRGNT